MSPRSVSDSDAALRAPKYMEVVLGRFQDRRVFPWFVVAHMGGREGIEPHCPDANRLFLLSGGNLRKSDAFQARCLRMILGIPHSFYARVPNTDVLSRAKTQKFPAMLLYRKLTFLHGIANLLSDDVMRTCVFEGQTMHIKIPRGKRRQRRPKATWSISVANFAVAMLDGSYELSDVFSLPQKWWKKRAAQFCFAVP